MGSSAKSKMLLVEGSDDMHVVKHLISRHGFEPNFEIVPKGGIQELQKSIYSEVNVPGRDALGILADANDNITGRWRSISQKLARADCVVPKAPSNSGSVFLGPRGIRVGVWLMPNNQISGELEDFVYDMIPANDPILPRAQNYIDNIPKKERKFKDGKLTRAYVHAWLAAREKSRPMGMAIEAEVRDLVHDVPAAKSLVAWLRKLFDG